MNQLHALTASLGASLGIAPDGKHADFGAARHVVLVLIDGMGAQAMQEHMELVPTLAAGELQLWQADVPTTTPVGLGAIGMGMAAGQHGLVGASFYLPETGNMLAPLRWPRDVPVAMVQPEPSVFRNLEQHGIRVASIGPTPYAHSGLTMAVFGSGDYRGVRHVPEYGAALTAVQDDAAASFTYVYWPELDRVGHRHGVRSPQWRGALATVNDLVAAIRDAAAPDSLIVVTADHGMVDVPQRSRIALEEVQALRGKLRHVGGEPRFRHLYVDSDAAELVERCRAEIGHAFDVFTREDAIARQIFGEVDPLLADRIGDLVCVANGEWMSTSVVDRRVSSFIGQHGAMSPAELLIPVVLLRS